MGPKTSLRGRARRTHSLGGCATCRRRHVKCDQVQPFCLTCKAVGVTCDGYSSSVQWMTPTTSTEKSKLKKLESNTTRRHLYTEQSRASMSTELTSKLPSDSLDASLTQIDSWSRNNRSSNSDNLAVGPFGVLSFDNTPSKSTPEDAPRPEESVVQAEPSEELFPTPSTLDPLMSLDDSLQWADLFALDFSNEFLMQQDPFGPIIQDLAPDIVSSGHAALEQPTWTSDTQFVPRVRHTVPDANTGAILPPVSPLVDSTSPSTDLVGDTHLLLRHFQDKVIDAMAGVPWTVKSPWRSLNLATAVQTLADMTYLGGKPVKHANAANLYSIVSSSARHLAIHSSSTSHQIPTYWTRVADWALERAKLHLDQSVRTEFQGPGKSKYKDQLMATLATVMASQACGNQLDVRRQLLEAERILRLRGLAKRELSRKARCLHHIYTWARIVGESTYVIHDYNSYAPVVQNLSIQNQKRLTRISEVEPTSGRSASLASHNARLDDFLRLDTQHDSDLEIDEPKEAEVGLHDIHLEDARDYPASMYLEIYGIPETWLSLVSQTTRLANVMDTLKVSNKETNVAFQNALQKRAGRLENMLCSFAFRTASASATPVATNAGDMGTATVLPNHYMLQALNSALVIFFYRRIRDVNPWILQSHVDDVIKALQDFDRALLDGNIDGPGTVWPAFMAGCEAIAPHRREALLRWIQSGRTKSGMHCYQVAEEVLTEVWRRRDEANQASPRTARSAGSTGTASRSTQTHCTWVDVSREKKIWLMVF